MSNPTCSHCKADPSTNPKVVLRRINEKGVTGDGCYVCERCHKVAQPSQREIDLAESMPAAKVELKCPGCHHRTVVWHPPSRPMRRDLGVKPVAPAMSQERGRALFLQLFQDLKLVR